MKTIHLLFISLLIVSKAFSQNVSLGTIADSSSITHPSISGINTTDKMHLSFETGVSFMSFGKQSAFNNWYAPALTYDLTPKFQLTAGAIALYGKSTFQTGLNSEGVSIFPQSTGVGQYFVFAQGTYLLNSKLTLSGTLFKEVPNNQINSNALSISHVDATYKVSDAFSISAGCTVVKGYNSSLMGGFNGFNIPTFPISGGFNNRTW
ncbi:MAG: hypothetical protein ABR968_06905 [Bacteroidales bacterium]|jgi:hypothetical protein